MTPLRSLNPLESMCSHLILCIVSPLPSFGDCQLGKGELSWWVSLSPLISFLSYFSGTAAATVSASSPGRRMLNVSLSFCFSIRLVATTLSELQEERALKNLLLHLNYLHLGCPRVPPTRELAVGHAFCFFRVALLFVSYSFSFRTKPGFVAATKHTNNSEQFRTWMESSSDYLFRSGEVI